MLILIRGNTVGETPYYPLLPLITRYFCGRCLALIIFPYSDIKVISIYSTDLYLPQVSEAVCMNPLFLIVGSKTNNIDAHRFPIYMAHTPAGTSAKCLWHYSQLINNGRFEMYDYGWNGNMER